MEVPIDFAIGPLCILEFKNVLVDRKASHCAAEKSRQMKMSIMLKIYRASEKSLRNREILAVAAGRPRFSTNEIWTYLAAVTIYPLARALFQARHPAPVIKGEAIAMGSRKRATLKVVSEGAIVMDDLEYDWVGDTWRFMRFGLSLKFYATLLRHLPFIVYLWQRKSSWSSAHYAVCLLEWIYLRSVLADHPQINTVYSGYYIDRKAFLLSMICEERHIRHIGVQHGAFNVFPRLHRAMVDEAVLIYPFSRPMAENFFKVSSPNCVRVAPEDFELGWSNFKSEKPFVVLGASADNTALNRQILDSLNQHLPPEFDIKLKLHPRDNRQAYEDIVQGRVNFIDINPRNASAYVGQLSSVIAEAWTLDIPIAVMHGAKGRGSDFQQMLDTEVHEDVDELAKAVSALVAEPVVT